MQHTPAARIAADVAVAETLPAAGLHGRTVYVSPTTRMIGHGIALSARPAGEDLRETVARLLATARSEGFPPVVVGAIPFDTQSPASLYVPERLERPGRPVPLAVTPGEAPAIVDVRQTPSPSGYRDAVARGLARIRRTDLKKLVLARRLELELDAAPDLAGLLATLMRRHPASFVYGVPLDAGNGEDAGVLLGASPELLVRKAGDRVFANPLAGTIAADPDRLRNARNIARLLASAKDRQEHAYTSRAVGETLRPFCRSLDVPETPSVLAAGPVNHLSTVITGELASPDVTALDLALALHPTPAVGGAPTAEALAAIADIEGFDRGLYAGMVGWCDENGDGEWAVTLRCAEIRGRRVRLFAGAGIVEGSDPEAEYRETETKLKTMLQALGLEPSAAGKARAER
ncbi:isochorismate synthase (plasmid) [Shinella yambaruensis]|uniref:isochorismate synthase n=1 Tax=Shinella yambaruensis TaxID=415996 RepID=UPI003D78E2E4